MLAFLKKVFLVIPIIAYFAIGATGGTDNENSTITDAIVLVGYEETIAVDVEDSNDLDIDVGGPKDIIACRCQHGSLYPGEGSTISIFSPFTSSIHPEEIKTIPFFSGVVEDELTTPCIRRVQDIETWTFCENEERNLDYTISLKILNSHDILSGNDPKMFICDVVYFSPYVESDYTYVLTWCRLTNEMAKATVTDGAISFPVEGESGVRIGALISPLLEAQIALNSIDLVGSFGDVPIRFKLRHRVYDSTGQLWVLAWRKWSRTR